MNDTPLSVLDLSPVPSGNTAADALRNSLDLARQTENLGYHRYWVAEHHLARQGSSVAAPRRVPRVVDRRGRTRTTRVRLVATVALRLCDPVRAAEDYATLDQLSGGRLELVMVTVSARRESTELTQLLCRTISRDGVLVPDIDLCRPAIVV
jgi:alkanesulfonate monooxygenase SsuD/methylene tetrahydromethanopterin reductase-like flavin-dependent oxidoreductase (luciferase family)